MKHLFTLALFVLTILPAAAQTAPAFDVASVRPSGRDIPQRSNVPLDAGNVYGTVTADDSRTAGAGLLIATHQPLLRLITFAYQLSGTRELALRFNMYAGAPKSGAPTWVTGTFTSAPDYFDITARAPADTSLDQMRLMMRTLLADRFHLAMHTQTADTQVLALTLAKPNSTGPHLQPHPTDTDCHPERSEGSASPVATTSPVGTLPPACGVISHVPSTETGQHYGGRAIPLALLATSLPTMTGLAAMPKPVVDQTGLTGLYDFTLTWVHDPTPDDNSIADNIGNFRSALKNQLGITLKPSHAPIEFLIVDHVEEPPEN